VRSAAIHHSSAAPGGDIADSTTKRGMYDIEVGVGYDRANGDCGWVELERVRAG